MSALCLLRLRRTDNRPGGVGSVAGHNAADSRCYPLRFFAALRMTGGLTRFPAFLFSSIALRAPFGLGRCLAACFCAGGGAPCLSSTVFFLIALFYQVLQVGWNCHSLAHLVPPDVCFTTVG